MLICTGSIGIDTTRTPAHTAERVLGGSGAYFCLAARFFAPVALVSVAGNDLPQQFLKTIAAKGKVDISGVQRDLAHKNFFFDSSFGSDLGERKVNAVEPNALAHFQPIVPPKIAARATHLYLATMPPAVQLELLRQTPNAVLTVMDTIANYIETDRQGVLKVISSVDGVVLNESEARLITGQANLLKAGKTLLAFGPKFAVIKKGEHGSLIFIGDYCYPMPAFPLEQVLDPTGAGDSFAGGLMGWLTKNKIGRDNLDASNLKRAVAFATVMGSFAVEKFSVERLLELSKQDVQKRVREYKALLKL